MAKRASLDEEIRKITQKDNPFNGSVLDARKLFRKKKDEDDEVRDVENKPVRKKTLVRWDLEISARDDGGAIKRVSLIPIYE